MTYSTSGTSGTIMDNTEIIEPTVSLAALAAQIRGLVLKQLHTFVEIGQALIAAKAMLKHGEWLPWLAVEFSWSDRSARNYMRIAEAFKSASLADLAGITITGEALTALAAPDVPQEVRDEAIEFAKAMPVTRKDAVALIEAAQIKLVVDNAPDGTSDETIIVADDEYEAWSDEDWNGGRLPVVNDDRWQETMRDWIDDHRDKTFPLNKVLAKFVDTIPLHDATRRWYFDFVELSSSNLEMRYYALLISLRSLGVIFNPPLSRNLCPKSGTEFTVPRRRRERQYW